MISSVATKEDKRFLWEQPQPLSSWNSAIGNSLCHCCSTTRKARSVTTDRLIREYIYTTGQPERNALKIPFRVNATLRASSSAYVCMYAVGSITIERGIQQYLGNGRQWKKFFDRGPSVRANGPADLLKFFHIRERNISTSDADLFRTRYMYLERSIFLPYLTRLMNYYRNYRSNAMKLI